MSVWLTDVCSPPLAQIKATVYLDDQTDSCITVTTSPNSTSTHRNGLEKALRIDQITLTLNETSLERISTGQWTAFLNALMELTSLLNFAFRFKNTSSAALMAKNNGAVLYLFSNTAIFDIRYYVKKYENNPEEKLDLTVSPTFVRSV